MIKIDGNTWYYSLDHEQLCQVIEAQTLWGDTTCRSKTSRSKTSDLYF